MAHQETIHGKLSEVMKMLALRHLHDVSVAGLCQKEDRGLLKAATGLTGLAETAVHDVSSTVRSPWARSGTMMSSHFREKLNRCRD